MRRRSRRLSPSAFILSPPSSFALYVPIFIFYLSLRGVPYHDGMSLNSNSNMTIIVIVIIIIILLLQERAELGCCTLNNHWNAYSLYTLPFILLFVFLLLFLPRPSLPSSFFFLFLLSSTFSLSSSIFHPSYDDALYALSIASFAFPWNCSVFPFVSSLAFHVLL